MGASETAHHVNTLATKTEDVSFNPETHMVEKRKVTHAS